MPSIPLTISGKELYIPQEIQKYWDISLPTTLQPTETIRAVTQIIDQKGENISIYTPKIPFRTSEDIINHLNQIKSHNPQGNVGISISTAVFDYMDNATPKISSFKYTNTIAIDIDTHISNTKERYPLGRLTPDQISYAMLRTVNEINSKFKEFGISISKPAFGMLTGGGLQVIFKFMEPLDKPSATSMFQLMKQAIGDLKYKVVLQNQLDLHVPIDFDIDPSFADISHVQRLSGVINQKYDIMAKELSLFDSTPDEITLLRSRLQDTIEDQGYTEAQKLAYIKTLADDFGIYSMNLSQAEDSIEVKNTLITAKMHNSKSFIRPSELKSIEYELLQKLKASGKETLDILHGEIRLGESTGNLTKLYCPFHEESNPSMAFYKNELFDVFKDFHDGAVYSLVTFWEKINNVSKSSAISQISEKAGLTLGKTERKEFMNLELSEIIDELINRVNTEDYIYYRLASKNRTCIVRHISSGEAFMFDGPKMLATHVLQNQLNIQEAELPLQEEFNKAFQEKIIIDAFEEFYPGKPTVFDKQFIKFVNLWVPSERYKRVHIRADEMKSKTSEPFSIEETLKVLKRKTPWTYKYILQVVQNGDLPWFINWLNGVANFRTVPTVPVIFGVQGAGKNLFVNTIMDFYLNNEYVKTVSGDRIMQQFNSMLESTSLLVLDEGDFSSNKEVDQLKLLTGNDKILIEKKGVDASNKLRHFNILFFSNGEVPLRHPAMDRRITYFNNEIPLLASCETWGISIDEMIEKVKEEMVEFWAIILNTDLDSKMLMSNSKNGQFWKQILLQHPFGALIVKLMNNQWEDIALQLNENVSDPTEMKSNLNLLIEIRTQFQAGGRISLTLVNRYIQSLNYRMKQSIQKFISSNYLHEFGIKVSVESDDVKIVVDKKKVQASLKMENVLRKAYPQTAKEIVSPLEAELAQEEVDVYIESQEMESTLPPGGITPPPPPSIM